MIIPCIDLMGGKVVQLVQGKEKALEGDAPEEMLRRFAAFPVIQVIDLDQAMGRGSNLDTVRRLASAARTRVGGGVRSVERARNLLDSGAEKVIVGTAAYKDGAPNEPFLLRLKQEIGAERVLLALDSKGGRVVIEGWRESTGLTAERVISRLEPYCGGFLCTYVDKEGMLEGTDLDWYRRLRAATDREITAAGGIASVEEIRVLQQLGIHAALGMAVYTGRLSLAELAALQNENSAGSSEMS